jgi:hypothetical protein
MILALCGAGRSAWWRWRGDRQWMRLCASVLSRRFSVNRLYLHRLTRLWLMTSALPVANNSNGAAPGSAQWRTLSENSLCCCRAAPRQPGPLRYRLLAATRRMRPRARVMGIIQWFFCCYSRHQPLRRLLFTRLMGETSNPLLISVSRSPCSTWAMSFFSSVFAITRLLAVSWFLLGAGRGHGPRHGPSTHWCRPRLWWATQTWLGWWFWRLSGKCLVYALVGGATSSLLGRDRKRGVEQLDCVVGNRCILLSLLGAFLVRSGV